MTQQPPRTLSGTSLLTTLSQYHPVVIEGMGRSDPRDPRPVAHQIHKRLLGHWKRRPPTKPIIVIIQGDPLLDRGISAITLEVAKLLGVTRGLVCNDDYHAQTADRTNVAWETRCSELESILGQDAILKLKNAIQSEVQRKNRLRPQQPLKSYVGEYALLQEVTKAACRNVCGDLTVAHTSASIDEFTVTSFYKVGIELGLVDAEQHMVSYDDDDDGDDRCGSEVMAAGDGG